MTTKAKRGIINNLDVAEEQVIFWRTHLDISIEDKYPPIKLTRDQHVIARAFGNGDDVKATQSRGSGKTWLIALCCHDLCTLYSGLPVIVCSATGIQATLVVEKIQRLAAQNPNIANEIVSLTRSKDNALITYKNGSTITAQAISSIRGKRSKVVVIDEALDVSYDDIEAAVSPTKNYRRDVSFNYGFKDIPSKTVCITSACRKSNDFYGDFMRVFKEMHDGREGSFACALDYKAAIANGISDAEYFEKERARMTDDTFAMEYGSMFLGDNANSVFPYEIIQKCRTLKQIEVEQPKGCISKYVIGVDIATSKAKGSDNTAICVIKFTEKQNGAFSKKLVYLQTYNGKPLDFLAEEVRKLYHLRFPNTIKIVFDARGLGDGFSRFFDKEWIDSSGKEYPPLVVDDEPNTNASALTILHPFRAVVSLNQRMYMNLRVCLEKQQIELPVTDRTIQTEEMAKTEDETKLTMAERAIFQESDGLQSEMNSIVSKTGSSGAVTFDVASSGLHKDRVSSVGMALDYVCELEKESINRFNNKTYCVGFASYY